jgi:cytidyltransferase-like protein
MREIAVGVLVGVFDLFNVGHLAALVTAAGRCDHLVVAVATDDLAGRAGRRRPFVPETEREQIVGAVRGVERVVLLGDDPLEELAGLLRETRAGAVLVLDDEPLADEVVATVAEAMPGVPLIRLETGRVTASAAVRAALDGPADRSSVA